MACFAEFKIVVTLFPKIMPNFVAITLIMSIDKKQNLP